MEHMSFMDIQANTKIISNYNFNKYDSKNLYTYEHVKPQKVFNQISLNKKEIEIFEIIKSVLGKNNKKTPQLCSAFLFLRGRVP